MLETLSLKPVYDSSEDSLITDLFIPLLSNSKNYYRGVGFFTSGWLKLAARGLVELISNDGKGHIIMSPILKEDDWKALKLGNDAVDDYILKKVLEESVNDISVSLEKDTLNALAWMIAEGLLEFKFAINRDFNSIGDYHDKVGIFIDENNKRVAIHGSFNDTYKGSLNGEAFSVFKSWQEGQLPFVDIHHTRVMDLWEGTNKQFRTVRIPSAIKEQIIKLRVTNVPPYAKSIITNSFDIQENNDVIELYDFQENAIKNWVANNYRGVLEMATGTGKTFTSLIAANRLFKQKKNLALIIIVPFLHLVQQWEENCRKIGFKAILCSSKNKNWNYTLKIKIQDFNFDIISNLCIIAVQDTASTENFHKIVKKLSEKDTMIIGDEVHNLGAQNYRKALINNTQYRLGLSATPHRWYDEEGTKQIFNFFGDICFTFALEEAIGRYLTPYVYYPICVHFTDSEEELYSEINKRISMLVNKSNKTTIEEERLKKLLNDRAEIINKAENKIREMENILKRKKDKNNKELNNTLIYFPPGTHKDVLKRTASLGVRCHDFVYETKLETRQKILKDFDEAHLQALIAIKCLDEGVDVPSTKIAFFLASTTNPREFVQRRGRVLRKHKNKEKAVIYDFFVVPKEKSIKYKRKSDKNLIKRQLPRFAEFSSSALNEFKARETLFNLLDHYDILHLMDKKPWEVYHENKNDL